MWYECEVCGFFYEELNNNLCYECHNERERSQSNRQYDRNDLD